MASNPARQRMPSQFRRSGGFDPDASLADASNAFVEWRYPYENEQSLKSASYDLQEVKIAIRDAILAKTGWKGIVKKITEQSQSACKFRGCAGCPRRTCGRANPIQAAVRAAMPRLPNGSEGRK